MRLPKGTRVVLGLVLAASGVLAACGSAASSPSATPTDAAAAALAGVDGSTNVAAYSAELDHLKPLCNEDRATLADEIRHTLSDEQQNSGPDTTTMQVMKNLATSAAGAAPTDCRASLAAYLVLVEPTPSGG